MLGHRPICSTPAKPSTTVNRTLSEAAVILAPRGRDAFIAQSILHEAQLDAVVAPDIATLVDMLRAGAGFGLITEETLHGADLRPLAGLIAGQEEWSDLPFIVLTSGGGGLERNPGARRLLATLGNVTFLERPFHPTTLVSLAQAALRARVRQYEARARLEDIDAGRERLQVALRAAGLGAWSMDLKSEELTASAECKSHYGRGPDESFTYSDLIASVHPEDRVRMQAAVRNTIATGTDYDIEYRCCWPDESVHWVKLNGRLETGSHGKPLRMVGVSKDITTRRQDDDRRMALLALGDGLRELRDPDEMSFLATKILGETLGVSRAGYGIINRAAETITINSDWQRPGTASLAGVLAFRDYGSYIEDLKRGETVIIADARCDERTAGTAGALEALHARALLNMPLEDRGEFVALLYLNHRDARQWTAADLRFVRDVADRTQAAIERRQAEIALAELAESLERQVIERTRESEAVQEQLRQAQKMEAVGQLTGGLAHDFNNMLTSVAGGLEMIATRVEQNRVSEIGKYVEMAQAGTRRAAALTHRLLAFSRRQTLDPKPTDVTQLVGSMNEFLQRSVGPAVDLTISGSEVWSTLLDRNQLENALLNLCINARDAMPRGGSIVIETANVEIDAASATSLDIAAGPYVRLSVGDTGSGMSAGTIERAFDPFFTTKPLGEGTGLGLSMIYGFARQSGGAVRIASQLGRGTTISMFFPRASQQAAVDDYVEARAGAALSRGGEHVLVVDDEPLIRALIVDVLDELGYSAVEAGDGPEGLELLNSHVNVDLLITDVGLPKGMNGRQLADAARIKRPDLKVLFITGYAETAVMGGDKLDDGMHVLTKPFELDVLANKVRELIDT